MSSPIPDPGQVPDAPVFTDEQDDREPAPDAVVPPEGEGDAQDGAVGSIEPPD